MSIVFTCYFSSQYQHLTMGIARGIVCIDPQYLYCYAQRFQLPHWWKTLLQGCAGRNLDSKKKKTKQINKRGEQQH